MVEKENSGRFFCGGFDNVFYSEIQHLSVNQIRIQQMKLCEENKMTEDRSLDKFMSEPTVEGVWM